MYEIDRTRFGFRITFAGRMDEAELREWIAESRSVLREAPDEFSVLVDMRKLQVLGEDEQELMREGQERYREAGMQRSLVLLNSAILTLQFRRLAKESGIYEYERYVNTEIVENWKRPALEWLVNGVDPNFG